MLENAVSAHGINTSIFFGGLSVGSAIVDVTGSSLNPQEVLQEFDMESNTLHFVLTKTDGINSTLDGAVARIVVQILEIDTGTGDSALYVKGGSVMQADGTLDEVAGTTVNSTFFEPSIDGSLIDLTSSTSHASCGIGGKAKVFANTSIAPFTYLWSNGASSQQITDLSPGIYAVIVTDATGLSATLEIEVQGQFIPIYDDEGNIIPCVTASDIGSRPSGLFLGQVQIDGTPAAPGDRITAIDENGNTAGLDLLSFFDGIAYINLPIYGDNIETTEDDGLTIGEYFTLQLYDASANTSYDYMLNEQLVEFTAWENTNGAPISEYNNTDDIYNFNGSQAICNQSINLKAGWNLISFNSSADNNLVAAVFADLIAAGNLAFVTGFDNGAKVFNPFGPPFLNTLTELKDGFGYWVKLANADVLNTGGGCIPIDYVKRLDAGWNLVAYPPIDSQSPSVYFANLIADGSLEFVTGFNGGTKTFDPFGPPFLNSLKQLENGFGYWLKVTNASAKTTNDLTNIFSFINGTSNLPVGEQVQVLNEKGETIAILEVIENSYLMTTPIYGDDETTKIKEYINIGESLRFSWNGQMADLKTTFKGDYAIEEIHLEFTLENNITLIDEQLSLSDVINIFPNPLEDKATIVYSLEKSDKVTITLFNANGQHITTIIKNRSREAGLHKVALNANYLSTGIYYLKLQSTEINIVEKLVVTK